MPERRYRHLETAANPKNLRRVAIDPVTRVEGHGKVTLLLDQDNRVRQARLHIVEFRGFEKFIQGRPYWEVPVLVQRLCGICPVSHLLAGAKAVDRLVGVDKIPPSAEKLRRLLHYGQVLQSHALHFFHLASPDLLFGFDSEAEKRNILELLRSDRFRDIALEGVRLRKFGQEVIRAVIGKRIHGVGPIPGGMNKHLSAADRARLEPQLDGVIAWARNGLELIRSFYLANADYHRRFAVIRSHFMALATEQGGHELYDGHIRVKGDDGRLLFDRLEDQRYTEFIHEQVKGWSYMKFPYLAALGPEEGWYRVGPLARINACDFIDTPLAERARQEFLRLDQGLPVQASLAYHWARMIEILHCAEKIRDLLADADLYAGELEARGEKRHEGIGVIEAPRGVLIHHYRIDDDGLVTQANLIVSTTHNNTAMNEAIRQVAAEYLSGRELTEPLLNRIEIAIRAYDPCLSCATHAIGKMPLEVELVDAEGRPLQRLVRHADGVVEAA
ncbi:NAD-reducing hydrogenase large subunit [Methylomarinovum tepidoasis]|uniref:NAD-reducing hydrogenase large subunit n=1 Tax=Methylomarinovum tepidoasis TaxID=2840183 RepID=A0AAU9CCK2_9GAMM|nr:Ni/Fe hydrogenase subunit alpha [Methylomarinovum sp. IN45]BCX89651.1 NAD-reducing hydrogenase large subunit [Methylomarinovum sp. IN45]